MEKVNKLIAQVLDEQKHPLRLLRQVARTMGTPGEVLTKLASHSDNIIRGEVYSNSSTPADTLHKVYLDCLPGGKNGDSPSVRNSVARNISTHPDTLHLAAGDENQYTRRFVADNPSTHPDTLHKLSTDGMANVRLGVARNTNAHTDTIRKLLTDSNSYVRAAADQQFIRRNLK